MPSRRHNHEERKEQDRLRKEKLRRERGVESRKPGLLPEQERLRAIRYATEYRCKNRDKVNAQRRKRAAERRKDPQYRVMLVLRSRLSQAMGRGVNKPMSTADGLGCTYAELRSHLERQFDDRMSWSNYGRKGWHIDHIKPLALFDLTDPVQFTEACHFTNLQPLWWKENLSKGPRLHAVASTEIEG